jgi:hypothetical protein
MPADPATRSIKKELRAHPRSEHRARAGVRTRAGERTLEIAMRRFGLSRARTTGYSKRIGTIGVEWNPENPPALLLCGQDLE